jgi:hypothetical protein
MRHSARDLVANNRLDFCAAWSVPICGSPLTYENQRIPREVHLYAASLADPSRVTPSRHVFVEEQLAWLEIVDQLPRFAKTSRGGAQPIRYGPRKT